MSAKPSFKLLSRTRLLHLLFWTVITLIFIYDRRYLIQKFQLPEHFIACVVVRMGLLISLVYLHLNVLVPRFFQIRRYGIYTSLLLLSLGIYVSLQNAYDIYLYGFVIGDVRSRDFWSAFPYNFFTTLWYLGLTAGLKLSLDHFREKAGGVQPEANLEPADRQVMLKSGTKQVRVDLNAVTHVKGLKDYSIVYTHLDQVIVKGSLKNAESLLRDKKMLRVHKSYLVAVDQIKAIESNQILMGTHSIPIGRSYKKELLQLLV